MSLSLAFYHRVQGRQVDVRRLRAIARGLFARLPEIGSVRLEIGLLGDAEMTRLNESFLRHAGTTDVITFDYAESAKRGPPAAAHLHGEIFICLDEARRQARRFRTSWQSELVRYLVHGVLHLVGHDDRTAAARRRMKREENRLVAALAARFPLSRLGRKPKLRL